MMGSVEDLRNISRKGLTFGNGRCVTKNSEKSREPGEPQHPPTPTPTLEGSGAGIPSPAEQEVHHAGLGCSEN